MASKLRVLFTPRFYVVLALAGTLSAALASFTWVVLGRGNSGIVSVGVVATGLFSFLLTLNFSWVKGESKEDFLKKGPLRTAIASSFTVAYLLFMSLSLAPPLGLSLDNGFLSDFHLVYLFIIGLYFGTASVERIVDLVKPKTSLFGS